eukprot:360774-Chlamydomonas_euryale.AAC.17
MLANSAYMRPIPSRNARTFWQCDCISIQLIRLRKYPFEFASSLATYAAFQHPQVSLIIQGSSRVAKRAAGCMQHMLKWQHACYKPLRALGRDASSRCTNLSSAGQVGEEKSVSISTAVTAGSCMENWATCPRTSAGSPSGLMCLETSPQQCASTLHVADQRLHVASL